MAFPFLAAAMGLSAAGGIGGSIFGARTANNQAKLDAQIAAGNQFQQGVDRESAILSAMRQQAEDRLGTTDVYGNRTKWVDGLGWVTEAAPEVQQNIDSALAEQMQQLTHDASRNRYNADMVSANARRADPFYDTYLRELSQTAGTRIDPNDRYQQDIAGQVTGFNRGFDDATEMYASQALRSGNATSARGFADIATERGKGLADIFAQSRTGARNATRSEFDADRGRASSMAGGFLDAAMSGPTGAPGTDGVDRGGNAGLGLASNRGAQNNALLAAAMGAPTPIHPGITLSNGTANAFTTAGAEIGSLGHGLGAAGVSGFGDGSNLDLMMLMKMMKG